MPSMSAFSHGRGSTSLVTKRVTFYNVDDYFELHEGNTSNVTKKLSFT